MRTAPKITTVVNLGALVLLLAAVVALFCTHRITPKDARDPASVPAAENSPVAAPRLH